MGTYNYPIILLYHQISDVAHSLINRYNINIHPKVFELHIRTIKKHFAPISVEEFEYSIAKNIDIRRRILITFDDGYEAAVDNGGAILKHHNLDSIWFVNGSFFGNKNVFWLSKLMWVLDEGLLVEFVKKANLRFPNILSYIDINDPVNINSWAKQNYSRTLDEFISEFVIHYGFDESVMAREAHLYASQEKLETLSLNACIGNHTSSHPNVINITLNDFYAEVEGCKNQIKSDKLNAGRYFAFPFGLIGHHWTPNYINIINDLGYRWAFSVANSDSSGVEYFSENVIPRAEVPCNITSESGLRDFVSKISYFQQAL